VEDPQTMQQPQLTDPVARASKQPSAIRLAVAGVWLLMVAACATTPPDPRVLDNAEQAISRAERAGGAEHAPLELRLANRRLDEARQAIVDGDAQAARHRADEAEIEAQLALARTQAALARRVLAERREALEALQQELVELYGPEVLP
jgi:F0F1-type ATP synthase membrane subunit b/b'